MHQRTLATTLLLAGSLLAPAAAQCHGIPDNVTNSGGCNVIPFGDADPKSASWSNQLYQTLVLASDLNNQAGLVTGLSFAPCGSGLRQFQRLTIRMGHCSSATMSTTFANNFTTPAQTVLDVRDFHWPNVANVWNRMPLETPFVYVPQLGNLLIEIHVEGVGMPGGTNGMNTGARPRMYARSWTGSPPPTGTLGSSAAVKLEVCLGTAGTATFGAGCLGSNQQAPKLDYTGSSKMGQTLSIDISAAAGVNPFVVLFGNTVAPPLPVQLDALGMPGCRMYTNVLLSLGAATNASGAGSLPVPVPNDPALTGVLLFNQGVVFDKAANALGLVATNGGQFVVGN